MIKNNEQFRISKENGIWVFNNIKKPQENGKKSWRKKTNKQTEEVIFGRRENAVFTQHWDRRSQTIKNVCEHPVSVQPLTEQPFHAVMTTTLSPSAWPDRLPAMSCFCLSAISQRTENFSRHQTWSASAQLAAHECRTCKQPGRPRWMDMQP